MNLHTIETHSTDLTEKCMMKGKLRREGKFEPETGTALFRGQCAHHAIEMWHLDLEQGVDPNCEDILPAAVDATNETLARDGREPSDTVKRDMVKIAKEVGECLFAYHNRFLEQFATCSLIGCELPIRAVFQTPMGEVSFASHVDLMFRDDEGVFDVPGSLHVWDWKYTEKAPTLDYLARNMQLAMYWMSVKHGQVLIDRDNEYWATFNEWPQVSWIHLPYLAPFKRKTTTKDDTGEVVEFVKGDSRPLRSIIKTPNFKPELEDWVLTELGIKHHLIANDLTPTFPDPVGCNVCESREFCTRFDTTN